MIDHAFPLFEQFSNKLRIGIFTKSDPDVSAYTPDSDEIAAQKLGAGRFASAIQVHDNRTVVVREAGLIESADGLATDQTDLCLITRWADCQNFVVYEPERNVLGILHSGWKGLVKGAIPEHIRVLQDEWNIEPANLFVAAGPSLCQRCSQFTDPAAELPDADPRFFDERFVDLQGIATDQWLQAGVKAEHIDRHSDCPRCKSDTYWSYRAEPQNVGADKRNILAAVLY